jgi:GNAT superfamily N-acetyltransferase
MTTVIPAEGVILDRILESTHAVWDESLDHQAYRKFDAAQMKTAWASRHQRRNTLVDGTDLLASAKQYNLAGVLDRRPVRVCGIGAVLTEPAHRGSGHARALIERLLDEATRDGAGMALLFSKMGPRCGARDGFVVIPMTEVELSVTDSSRHGAPMTMVRGGEERDLAAVVAMGQVRARPFRFHLDQDVDLVQYAITKKRLLAGLGSAGAAWLPPGFVPPQATIMSARPSTEVMTVRFLGSTVVRPRLSGDDCTGVTTSSDARHRATVRNFDAKRRSETCSCPSSSMAAV